MEASENEFFCTVFQSGGKEMLRNQTAHIFLEEKL